MAHVSLTFAGHSGADGRAPYGVWKVKRRFMPRGWVEGRREDSDVAFAVVAPRGGKGVEDAVGGYRFATGFACPGFAGSTSGSPWVNGDGQVVGILGGHEDGGTTPDVSYSVVLGAQAGRLYREAAGDP
ncbi:hypothetical protein GCM10010244_74580 [Streptomyces coeruleorubidus]|nr:hypothetical protein GCM10010244_74580 [Streptomyces bellus]